MSFFTRLFGLSNAPTSPTGNPSTTKVTWRDSWAALQYIPPFLKKVYQTHPYLALANILLRLFKTTLPLATLYLGKLIIDEVVKQMSLGAQQDLNHLWQLVAIELGLVLASEILSRLIALSEALLSDLFANQSSVELMRHASAFDLEQFEDASIYDKLERARRQTNGRVYLMTNILAQVQDIIGVITLSIGLIFFNPWLILLLLVAVIPAFIAENY
ncbi:MAG TPA: ABC transporter ATP-binding protein, partial [Microscillaceae bacterium]|nr:ABC transporter ATP-binding protein [Microscillaceae bacterium]